MRIKTALIVLTVLCTTGCIHKATPITPWERVMTDNALLAQFVDTAEQGTELAVSSGVLSASTAKPVIRVESRFPDVHKKITAILAQGSGADFTTANALLDQFKADMQALIASGEIGIKNPKTQMSISGDLNNIVNLTKAVLADIQLIHPTTGGTP